MGDKVSMEIELDGSYDWIKLNCGAVGFYRVEYDDKLSQQLKVDQLLTRDRLQHQSDTFALAKAGYIPMTKYLDTIKLYKSETDYAVLADIMLNLSEISKVTWNMDQ